MMTPPPLLSLNIFSTAALNAGTLNALSAGVTGQLADTPTRGLPTRGLDDSRTGQLAYWKSRGLDNSRMPSATLRA